MNIKNPACLALTVCIAVMVCSTSLSATVKGTAVNAGSAGTAAEDQDSADGSQSGTTTSVSVAASGSTSVIIAVEGQDKLLERYGLWYVGQSTDSADVLSDGSAESMAELAARGVRGWVRTRDGGYKYIDEDGTTVTDLVAEIDGYTYGFDSAGWMITGWWSPDESRGQWYYFYPEGNEDGYPTGSMACGTVIDGYEINESGIYSELDPVVSEILDEVGWTLKGAYNYSAGLTYYRFTADPQKGIAWFADYGFSRGYGNCYVMAATFCVLARALGYEAWQMAGYVPKKGGGITPHSWCELIIDGETRVFDPNYTNETGNDGYNIYYGKPGTWKYQSYDRMPE